MKMAPLVTKMEGGLGLIVDWASTYLRHRIQHGTMADTIIPKLNNADEGTKINGWAYEPALKRTREMEVELSAYDAEIRKILAIYKKDVKILGNILKNTKPEVSTTGRTLTEKQIALRKKKRDRAKELWKRSNELVKDVEDTINAGFTALGKY